MCLLHTADDTTAYSDVLYIELLVVQISNPGDAVAHAFDR